MVVMELEKAMSNPRKHFKDSTFRVKRVGIRRDGQACTGDPLGLFSSSMLAAAQPLTFWCRTRGSAAAWLAPSQAAGQGLAQLSGPSPGRSSRPARAAPGSEAPLPAAARGRLQADFTELRCKNLTVQ